MNKINIETLLRIYNNIDNCTESLEKAIDKTAINTRCWKVWEGIEKIIALKSEMVVLTSIKYICDTVYSRLNEDDKSFLKEVYIDKLSAKQIIKNRCMTLRTYYRHINRLLWKCSVISDGNGYDDDFYNKYFLNYSYCQKIQKEIRGYNNENL